MSDGFLSRWSQRKNEARRAGGGSTPQSDEAAGLAPDAPRQLANDPGTPAAAPALTPEELAALPKIDALTADSDIAGFLRRGVPEGLRNAALRKMWMLDPAIRNFVGHARDYAYDWNTPGGVPGSGALQPGDDVAAMVRRIFGEPVVASSGQSADQAARDRAAAVRSIDRSTAAGRQGTASAERKSAAVGGETKAGSRGDPAQPAERLVR